MKSPDYDEIDALLASIDDVDDIDALLLGDDHSQDVDEVDALLGGIDDDFISPQEEIYLSNKEYLANTPQDEVDKDLLKLQDEMIANVEDILEEYSGGCLSGEHFGLDDEYQEMDELESQLDDMLLGLDDVFSGEHMGGHTADHMGGHMGGHLMGGHMGGHLMGGHLMGGWVVIWVVT